MPDLLVLLRACLLAHLEGCPLGLPQVCLRVPLEVCLQAHLVHPGGFLLEFRPLRDSVQTIPLVALLLHSTVYFHVLYLVHHPLGPRPVVRL